MTTDLTQLVQDFYNYFLNLYHQKATNAGGAQSAFLAFEAIGTPLTPDMFQLQGGMFDKGLVIEQFSMQANRLPHIEGTTIQTHSLLTADGYYGTILDQAAALPSADLGAFGAMKSAAQQSFRQAEQFYRTLGGGEYRPVLCTPPDWPMPSGAGAWTTREFKQTEKVTTGTPPPPRKIANWQWRVAPMQLRVALANTRTLQETITVKKPAPVTKAMPIALKPAMTAATAVRRRNLAVAFGGAAPAASVGMAGTIAMRRSPAALGASPAVSSAMLSVARSDVMSLQVKELANQSTPQAVTSKSVSMKFDYCLVTGQRNWVSTPFLLSKAWYVPGTKAGEFADGTSGGDIHNLDVIPSAAIVVKNLSITADWSQEDRVALGGNSMTSFGPFSLVGKTYDSVHGVLSNSGMQIVGWIFEVMPVMPPNSDPALK